MTNCPEPTEAQDDRAFTYYREKRAVAEDRWKEIEAELKGDLEREERDG